MIGLTPDIAAVEVLRHGVVRLTFQDGLSGEVELLGLMQGPVFEEARTRKGFERVRVDPEAGTIVWPGDADFAPDTLYIRVKTGKWPRGLRAR